MAQMKKNKSTEKMPARRVPEGFEFPKNNKAVPNKPTAKPKVTPKPKPKVTKKPEKMTPQDAAMKKILEGKYGKIYG